MNSASRLPPLAGLRCPKSFLDPFVPARGMRNLEWWTRNAMEIWKMMVLVWVRRKKEEWGQCFVLSGSGGGGGVGLVGAGAGGKTGNAGSPFPPPGGTATNEDVPNSLYQPIT